MEFVTVINILWIGALIIYGISSALINNEEEKNISEFKSNDTPLVIILKIFAQLAFNHPKVININMLTKHDKIILYKIIQFYETMQVTDENDLDFLIKTFIEISKDRKTFSINLKYDAYKLLERVDQDIIEIVAHFSIYICTNENGRIPDKKSIKLDKLFEYLNINFDHVDDQSSYDNQSEEEKFSIYYKLLKVNSNSTKADINRAYRKLCKEYHPDVLESKGLPEDMIKYSQERFNEITEAKNILMDIHSKKGKSPNKNPINGTKKSSHTTRSNIKSNKSKKRQPKYYESRKSKAKKMLQKSIELIKEDLHNEAILYLSRSIELASGNASSYYYRYKCYEEMNDDRKAIHDLQKAAQLGHPQAIKILRKKKQEENFL